MWDFRPYLRLSGAAYPKALRRLFCLEYPAVEDHCACCRHCYAHHWEAVPPPLTCHACYLCVRRHWWSRITVADFANQTETELEQGELGCSQNQRFALRSPKVSCWPHTKADEDRLREDVWRRLRANTTSGHLGN